MNKIKYLIQDYFGFSSKETNGFIGVMICMGILLTAPQVYKRFASNNPSTSVADRRKLDSLVTYLESNASMEETHFTTTRSREEKLFAFDPNTSNLNELTLLGIPEATAKRIINYRSKGGKFKIKSDFKKIYGLSTQKYDQLFPFINLPEAKETLYKSDNNSRTSFTSNKERKSGSAKFDINAADTSKLIALKGIGSKLAQRIINFRDKLGGFVDANQYKEVYGLDSAVVQMLNSTAIIDNGFAPKKININTAPFETLKEHPYIRFKLAKVIVAYRNQHHKFETAEDLKDIKIITEQEIHKLKPYLEF